VKKVFLLSIGAFVLVVALVFAGLATGLIGTEEPSGDARADIPATYLRLYMESADLCPGLSWTILAAIGKVETNHGRLSAPGVSTGQNFAGAAGPMQFGIGGKAGNTWGGSPVHAFPPALGYGIDGPSSGDGLANVYDPADAIPAAARYLCAHGLRQDPNAVWRAIFAYNHADWYVRKVLAQSRLYAAAPGPVTGVSAPALLANPRLILTPNARYDLRRNVVDPRVLAVLAQLLQSYTLKVSVFSTGHSLYVEGTTRVSNHIPGRAVDIFEINGEPVSRNSGAALAVTAWLVNDDSPLRADEIGSPFEQFEPLPGAFSNASHQDHLHIGYNGS
jgi:hypothetical protein